MKEQAGSSQFRIGESASRKNASVFLRRKSLNKLFSQHDCFIFPIPGIYFPNTQQLLFPSAPNKFPIPGYFIFAHNNYYFPIPGFFISQQQLLWMIPGSFLFPDSQLYIFSRDLGKLSARSDRRLSFSVPFLQSGANHL